jgi:N utilization substance protein A
MDVENLIESFSEFKEMKNIDRETMMNVLEEVFRTVMAKQYGTDENIDVIINVDKGDLELWRNREIVNDADLEDASIEIAYSDAVKIEPDFEVGEEVSEQIFLKDFGRRQVMALRQTLVSRIMDLEKKEIYDRYEGRVGEIVNGEVYQVWRNEVLILDGEENELILPKSEAIPNDYFKKGDNIRAVVKSVEMRNHNPLITLSRTAPEFLARLFEQEVPEVFDGLITIKNIVRVPGERAKVAVESYDERIDPVGACVGM